MIQALLDLADALHMQTPAPFEKKPVHYFLDLDLDGKLIGISPTCRSTEKGAWQLGKEFDCPVFFPLISKDGEIKSNGGGGISVAELATGDSREIFRTTLLLKDGDWQFEHLNPPASDSEEEEEEEDANGKEPGGAGGKKSQFYRHRNWIDIHRRLFEGIRAQGNLTCHHESLQKFIDTVGYLDSDTAARLLALPDPKRPSESDTPPEEAPNQRKQLRTERNRVLKSLSTARLSFRVCGKIMLYDAAIIEWWRSEYARLRKTIAQELPRGDDGYTPSRSDLISSTGRLTSVFPNIRGVPKSGMWCPFASFDKAPFKSYGLGKMTASVRLETAERTAGALNFLLRHPQHHYNLGGTVAVFWAVRQPDYLEPLDICDLLDSKKNPDPLEVLDFFKNIQGHSATLSDEARFHCALMSSPKARITVRSWHTDTLSRVSVRSRDYFETVSLPTIWDNEQTSSLKDLAEATISDSSKGGPPNSTHTALFNCIFFGRAASSLHQLFAQAVRRQAIELAAGCTPKSRLAFESRLRHRAALIRLYFNLNRHEPMNGGSILNGNCQHPAVLSGRLLAMLDKIHREAHVRRDANGKVVSKGTASSPANRFYGSASKTPALVFPRLLELARYHLAKINGNWAYRLEFGFLPEDSDGLKDRLDSPFIGLAGLVAQLKLANRAEFPRLFTLEEQGRFALGFYYERCRRWPQSKDRSAQSGEVNDSQPTEVNQ